MNINNEFWGMLYIFAICTPTLLYLTMDNVKSMLIVILLVLVVGSTFFMGYLL